MGYLRPSIIYDYIDYWPLTILPILLIVIFRNSKFKEALDNFNDVKHTKAQQDIKSLEKQLAGTGNSFDSVLESATNTLSGLSKSLFAKLPIPLFITI